MRVCVVVVMVVVVYSFHVPHSEEIALQMILIHFLQIIEARKVGEWRPWYSHVLIRSGKV